MFKLLVFSPLILRHIIFISTILQQKCIQMSISSRQLKTPKQLLRETSSGAFTHQRNGSVESRNFGQLLQLGRKYYHNNQISQAIEILQRGLYYDPLNLEINYLLGVSFLSSNRHQQALQHLTKVSKLNENYRPKLMLLLSIAYKKTDQYDLAYEVISKQIQIHDDIDSMFFRARISMKMASHQKCLQDLQSILTKMSNHAPAILMKVHCLEILGNFQSALETIRLGKSLVEDIGKQIELKMEEARLFSKLNQHAQALIVLESVQSEYPLIPSELYLLKAKINQEAGRSQEAIMIYNQLLGKNSSPLIFSTAIAEAAISCMKERDFYQAFAYLKRTQMIKIKSKANDQLLRLAEGVTFLMKKKYAEGIVLMGSCLLHFQFELSSHIRFLNNLLNNALAFANFNLNNHQIALSLYQKILPQPNTDMSAASYNICICKGILKYNSRLREDSLFLFERAKEYVNRPEPFFYQAVILNEEYVKESMDTDGFVKILELIEQGLRAGQNAHMYYYRAILYLYLGMNGQALEDIDRAIEKSQDNVARYFHARGVIFFLDKNYQQALLQFGTALSIDDLDELSTIEKAKCQLLTNQSEAAYATLVNLDSQKRKEWTLLFRLHEKMYSRVLQEVEGNVSIHQICCFMEGKFQESGPSGKLILAILYENYQEVINLIEEAIGLGVSIGCLDTNDLLILKAFCQYRMEKYQESLLSLNRVENNLRESSGRSDTYSEDEERKLLMCRVNAILVNFKKGHQLESIGLAEELLNEVCQGPVFDQLSHLKTFLSEGGQHQIQLGFNALLLSDFFAQEHQKGLTFRFLIPMPNYKVSEVEYPQYQQLLTTFSVKDIQSRPQAPWIRRGRHGLIFTNDVREFQNLNLQTEQNQGIRSRLPTNEQSQNIIKKRSQLIEQLKLSLSVINKLEKISKKGNNV